MTHRRFTFVQPDDVAAILDSRVTARGERGGGRGATGSRAAVASDLIRAGGLVTGPDGRMPEPAEWKYIDWAGEWELRLGDLRVRLYRWGTDRWVRKFYCRALLMLEDAVNAPNATEADTTTAQDEARAWARGLLVDALGRVGGGER